MKQFDLEGARREGYSDAEIADFLGARERFDVGGARQEGYSDGEIITKLAVPKAPKPAEQKFDVLSLMSEAGRQVGLTARHAVTGLTAIPNMIGDAVGLGSSRAVSDLMTKIGLPEPANATERVVGDISSAMAGGGGTYGLGVKMSQAASPLAKGAASILTSQPGVQALSNATGAGAAGATREAGGDGSMQILASLLGSTIPGLASFGGQAALRGAMRGGEQGREALTENLRTLMDIGVKPTVGLATGNRRMQGLETVLSRTPGSAGRMADAAEGVSNTLGARVTGLADDLAPHADPTLAGMAIERGVKEFVKGFQGKQAELFGVLDRYIPEATPVSVKASRSALDDLSRNIPGAEGISEIMKNPKIAAIAEAMKIDSGNSGSLPYSAIKALRTEVGKVVSESPLVSGAPNASWRRLYGALTSDMEAAARNAGPEAERAFSRANDYTRAGMGRIDDHLERSLRPTAEQTYQTLVSEAVIRTGRKRKASQCRVLLLQGIPYKLDGDGRPAVLLAAVETSLGLSLKDERPSMLPLRIADARALSRRKS